MVDVNKIVAKWAKIKEALSVKDTSVDSQGGKEPEGGIERQGSGELQGGNPEAASKERGQPKTRKLSSKDGVSKGTRAGRKGKTNASSSQPKSVGSKQQGGRKSKGASNKSKKQSKEG